jgi:hypothetical protein
MSLTFQEAATQYARCWIGSGGQATAGGVEAHEWLDNHLVSEGNHPRYVLSLFVNAYTDAYAIMLRNTDEKPAFQSYCEFFHHRFKDEPDAQVVLDGLLEALRRPCKSGVTRIAWEIK